MLRFDITEGGELKSLLSLAGIDEFSENDCDAILELCERVGITEYDASIIASYFNKCEDYMDVYSKFNDVFDYDIFVKEIENYVVDLDFLTQYLIDIIGKTIDKNIYELYGNYDESNIVEDDNSLLNVSTLDSRKVFAYAYAEELIDIQEFIYMAYKNSLLDYYSFVEDCFFKSSGIVDSYELTQDNKIILCLTN